MTNLQFTRSKSITLFNAIIIITFGDQCDKRITFKMRNFDVLLNCILFSIKIKII